MIRDVKVAGADDDVLRARAAPVTVFDEALGALTQDLIDTMESQNGAGIAAPQIGVSQRVIVIAAAGAGHFVMVNPEIVERAAGTFYPNFSEGCLSVPGVFGMVPRSWLVRVRFADLAGDTRISTFRDTLAVVIQHEIDHLNGRLFTDVATSVVQGAAVRAREEFIK